MIAFAARRVSLAAGGAAGDSLGLFAAETVIGAVALGSMMVALGAMQWLAGRRHLPWAPRLVLSRGAAGAAGGATALGTLAALTDGEATGGAVVLACALGLGAFWAAEWLVLRGRAAGARKLASMSAAGLVAAVLATGLAGAVAGDLGAEWVAGAVFGAAHGAVTGIGAKPPIEPAPATG